MFTFPLRTAVNSGLVVRLEPILSFFQFVRHLFGSYSGESWSLNPSSIAATTVSKRERIRWGPSRQDSDTEHLVLAPMTHKAQPAFKFPGLIMYHLDRITSSDAHPPSVSHTVIRIVDFGWTYLSSVMFGFRTSFQLDHIRYSFQILYKFIFNLIIYIQKS